MSSFNDQIVQAAREWIGTPYVHQARLKLAGTDCLGLLLGVWEDVIGPLPETPPAYSPDWSEPSGEEVLLQAAKRRLKPAREESGGQVLLFRMHSAGVAKHVGITAQSGKAPTFIHAYSGHGVVESNLSNAWRRRVVARFDFPKGA